MLQARDGYLAELEELIPTMEALVAEKMSLEEQAEQMKAQLRGLQEAGHEVCLGARDLSGNCCQGLSAQGRQVDADTSCSICRRQGHEVKDASHTLACHAELVPLWQRKH